MKRMSGRKSEHGVALVISLVLITIASIGAVTAMRSGHLQDRMASNQHNKVISQMAAEAGASALLKWIDDNSTQDLATVWGSSPLGTLPANAQLPPHGFYYLPNAPTWNTNPVVAEVYGLSRKNGQTLAETRIRLELSNTGDFGELVLPAPLTIGGRLAPHSSGTPAFTAFTSSGFRITGGSSPAIVKERNDANYPNSPFGVNIIQNAIPNNRAGNYTGAGVTSKSVTSMELGDLWGNANALRDLVSVASGKGVTVASFNEDCRRSPVCVVQGAADIGSSTLETRLLIVTGNLDMGAATFGGLIVTLGGRLNWGGGGSGGGFEGGIYVANVVKPTSGNWTFAAGGSRLLMNGGGSASLTYNAVDVSDALGLLSGWSVASWREIL